MRIHELTPTFHELMHCHFEFEKKPHYYITMLLKAKCPEKHPQLLPPLSYFLPITSYFPWFQKKQKQAVRENSIKGIILSINSFSFFQ
jgi:hypothetical protein